MGYNQKYIQSSKQFKCFKICWHKKCNIDVLNSAVDQESNTRIYYFRDWNIRGQKPLREGNVEEKTFANKKWKQFLGTKRRSNASHKIKCYRAKWINELHATSFSIKEKNHMFVIYSSDSMKIYTFNTEVK